MISNNSNTLAIIRDVVIKLLPNSRILLFGSRARKDHCSDSDYDFLVITKDTLDIQKKRTIKSLLRKELAQYKIPADILIQSEEEITCKQVITGHILKQVLKEGVAI